MNSIRIIPAWKEQSYRCSFTLIHRNSLKLIAAPGRLLPRLPALWVLVGQLLLPLGVQAKELPQQRIDTSEAKQRLVEQYGELPLTFEANQGQTDPQVRFFSRNQGYSLFLTPTEVVLLLRKSEKDNEPGGQPNASKKRLLAGGSAIVADRTASPQPTQASKSAAIRMKLIGANQNPQIIPLEKQPGKVNYLIGNDSRKWQTDIATYGRVKYENVYPGVDLVFYGNQRQLEYDLMLAPGADVKAITLGFDGTDQVRVDAQGDLVLEVGDEEIRQLRPLIYQVIDGVTEKISGRYVINGKQQIQFEIAAYDVSRPLVIDPVLTYSTYLGGNGRDLGSGIAVDALGNAYVAGETSSSNFPTTAGPIQMSPGGGLDAFVAKLNPTGTGLIYSTYLGGNGDDAGYTIVVDVSNNAYLTGETRSSNFPTTLGAFQTSSGGSSDAFVAVLNPTGTGLIYSTYLGGNGYDNGYGLAVDASGNAYVTGYTLAGSFPTTPGAFQTSSGGGVDVFVAALNPAGAGLIYSTYLGGNAFDSGAGIVVDALGNAYVTGPTTSPDFPITPSALQTAFAGGSLDAFVAVLNPAGTGLIYSSYLGGNSDDYGYGIAVDGSKNAYVTGYTGSSNFPTTPGVFQTSLAGGISDAFVAVLDPTGTALIYSTLLGGNGHDVGVGIAVDASENAYVTGYTDSGNFPTTASGFQTGSGGNGDAFVAMLNPTGTGLNHSTYLGGNSEDIGSGIAVDALGNVYVTGYSESGNFPTTTGAFQTSFGGASSDGFVAKFGPVSNVDTTPPTISSSVPAVAPEFYSYIVQPSAGVPMIDVGLSFTATDSGSPGTTEVRVYSNEANGTGLYSPDATFSGGILKLRAQRDPNNLHGRVYLIVIKATDSAGNSSFSNTTVGVPRVNYDYLRDHVHGLGLIANNYFMSSGPAGQTWNWATPSPFSLNFILRPTGTVTPIKFTRIY